MPVPAANPLLAFPGLPRFDRVTPADVAPAVDTLLDGARATIVRSSATPRRRPGTASPRR